MYVEPETNDPEDLARKYAAAPTLKTQPPVEWIVGPNGRIVGFELEGMGFWRKLRNRGGEFLYNEIITHIPSHNIRLGFLRLCGATIGKGSAIMRTTRVIDIEFLTIGNCSTIGARCLLDARNGLWIGDNVTIASDVQLLPGGHMINHPDFLPGPVVPTVIEDYVWIASRATVLPTFIRRGAVVGAQALVAKDIGECEVVGGNPAKVIAKRNPDALQYRASYRPLFY